jgi:hypothetical protein
LSSPEIRIYRSVRGGRGGVVACLSPSQALSSGPKIVAAHTNRLSSLCGLALHPCVTEKKRRGGGGGDTLERVRKHTRKSRRGGVYCGCLTIGSLVM